MLNSVDCFKFSKAVCDIQIQNSQIDTFTSVLLKIFIDIYSKNNFNSFHRMLIFPNFTDLVMFHSLLF